MMPDTTMEIQPEEKGSIKELVEFIVIVTVLLGLLGGLFVTKFQIFF
jgi:hypothetical protein